MNVLGNVHKYFGGGAGQNGGGQKSFRLPERGDRNVFVVKGGQKSLDKLKV